MKKWLIKILRFAPFAWLTAFVGVIINIVSDGLSKGGFPWGWIVILAFTSPIAAAISPPGEPKSLESLIQKYKEEAPAIQMEDDAKAVTTKIDLLRISKLTGEVLAFIAEEFIFLLTIPGSAVGIFYIFWMLTGKPQLW
ncbi:hypothetical protein [Amycolatopsis sp. NBC_01286]|uniref:hypothetical protein n=1 Tax=Amycolatopsis sp. NBC_01286 TaxID=2903560 RepID=UPI002E104E57|nr:hypothetical protein OG570_23425 [Amycolatopsis sp. NBC_01286]